MVSIFFVSLLVACIGVLRNENALAAGVLTIGFLQDPARKLIEGEPVAITVMVAVVFACATFRQMFLRSMPLSEPFSRWSPSIVGVLQLFLLIVAVQFFHSWIRYGSVIVSSLGLIFYLAPLAAISVTYHCFSHFGEARQMISWFCLASFIVALTVLASFVGIESDLLGEVGSGLLIYDQGTILEAHSGIMRSSEIAGWHMGAGVCLLVVLYVSNIKSPSAIWVALALGLMIAAILVTGRRKMLFQIMLFLALYLPVIRLYERNFTSKYLLALALLLPLAWLLFSQFSAIQAENRFDLYLTRGSTVFGDASERFASLGLGSIDWALHRFGLFGGGVGVAAQGAQHFGETIAGGAAEGGLGKIVSELGVPSLLVIAILFWQLGRHLDRCMKLVANLAPRFLYMMVGILVFLISNIPTFIVASPVFGDVFVLTILGMLGGILFAIPKLVTAHLQTKSKAEPSGQTKPAMSR